MIIPSRYLAGGKGLSSFRDRMLNDRHVSKMVDFINAKDCFPQNSVGGGVNYFLWERDYQGDCEFTTVRGQESDTRVRALNEFPTFVRYNKAIDIIHKVLRKSDEFLNSIISSRNPFGLPTSTRGHNEKSQNDLLLVSSKGRSFISRAEVEENELIDSYKVLISRITYEHAGEPDKEGKLRVLSKIEVLGPGELCTDSYLVAGPFRSEGDARAVEGLLKSKFARFLISQTLSSINLSKDKFCFVPLDLNQQEPYSYYGLTRDEIDFIEGLIHPMD
jgi:site-specific DNA-methyltransferase (adenine-specific)